MYPVIFILLSMSIIMALDPAMVMDHDDLGLSHLRSTSSGNNNIVNRPVGLPVGYRFRPTDVELVKYYLQEKAFNPSSPLPAHIGVDIDASEFRRSNPSQLVHGFRGEEREWYFFVRQHNSESSESESESENEEEEEEERQGRMKRMKRTVLVGGNNHSHSHSHSHRVGFWQAGSEKTIDDSGGMTLAYKTNFTYCLLPSQADHQRKTHWKLHEYRLHSPRNLAGQEWVLARLIRGADYGDNSCF